MPRSVRILRLFTALVTLAIVVGLLRFGDGSSAARAIAAIVLLLGAGQWLMLGSLAKRFSPPD